MLTNKIQPKQLLFLSVQVGLGIALGMFVFLVFAQPTILFFVTERKSAVIVTLTGWSFLWFMVSKILFYKDRSFSMLVYGLSLVVGLGICVVSGLFVNNLVWLYPFTLFGSLLGTVSAFEFDAQIKAHYSTTTETLYILLSLMMCIGSVLLLQIQ